MDGTLDHLNNHIIVCGLDTLGQSVCNTLHTEGRPFVVVEQNQAWIQEVADKKWLIIQGDPTEEGVWEQLHLTKAHSIISTIEDETTDLQLILTVRD